MMLLYNKRFSLIFLLLFLFSCTTLVAKKQPNWIFNPPGGDKYYLGVGASSTGNKGEDYQVALERAKSNLAADISVKIVTESHDTFRETNIKSGTDDEVSNNNSVIEQYEQKMTQFVENNLKDIEVVNKWENRKEGTWVFVRLNKAAYERMKQKEMAELRSRVLDQINPILDGSVDIQDGISRYFNAWNMVFNSFYVDEIKGEISGKKGFLIDRIESKIVDYFDSLIFNVKSKSPTVEVNKPLPLTLSVSIDGIEDGRVPLQFVQNGDGNILASITTKSNGTYSQPVKLDGLKGIGKVRLRCILDLSQFDSELAAFGQEVKPPGEDFSLIINLVKLGFTVDTGGVSVAGIENSLKSLLRKKELPIELLPGKTGDRDLLIEVVFSVMPKVFENQPQIVKSKAIFVLKENGNTVFSYETKEVKNGGATEQQAYYNSWSKLQKIIDKDAMITIKILEAI